ncbi:uncharacterized protein C8Q71DRAFT_380273 [Rhodofomes roseus]|uniref:F-box domain-containing protein n=1 Tax=Rhodofomes roseus TaxID=34475 RepID=A0ABQ8K0H0_9APHY|nr:uncharacterized protein C8Q71DRAFT_380273 [Rhodofomes roseus]KAH9830150.1 hypothetical protein C8Q71DRAFT_380273 [Rhodofomes roseus]
MLETTTGPTGSSSLATISDHSIQRGGVRAWSTLRRLTNRGARNLSRSLPREPMPFTPRLWEGSPGASQDDAQPNVPTMTAQSAGLPLELWWQIIDQLQYDWLTLLACGVVCRGWRARAQSYLPQGYRRTVELYSQRDVASLSRFARVRNLQAQTVQIHGNPHSGSIAHLGTFAAMLSGRLCHLNELHVMYGIWETGTVDTCTLFRCLSTHSAIRHLRLCGVTLPSTTALLRLLSSLPRLRSLDCVDISTTAKHHGDRTCVYPPRRCKIEKFVLDCPDVDSIFDLFATDSLAEYSSTVEVGIHSAYDADEGPSMNFTRFIKSLTSVSRLTIVVRDADMSDDEPLARCLYLAQHHCERLEYISVQAVPRARPLLELTFICAILSFVTINITKRFIMLDIQRGYLHSNRSHGHYVVLRRAAGR